MSKLTNHLHHKHKLIRIAQESQAYKPHPINRLALCLCGNYKKDFYFEKKEIQTKTMIQLVIIADNINRPKIPQSMLVNQKLYQSMLVDQLAFSQHLQKLLSSVNYTRVNFRSFVPKSRPIILSSLIRLAYLYFGNSKRV